MNANPTSIQGGDNAAKEQFRLLVKNYARPVRGKLALLAPLREELLELDRKGATTGEIAGLLAQCQITVSKDSVARFLRTEAAKRPKKNAAPPPTSGSESTKARPLMPRGLSDGEAKGTQA